VFNSGCGWRAILHGLRILVPVLLTSGCAVMPLTCLNDPDSVECLCDKDPDSIECVCAKEPDSAACLCGKDASSADCACARDPESSACFCERNPGAAECQPCPSGSASSLTADALRKIDVGDWRSGRRLVDCAVERSPANAMARGIREQLDTDPATYFRSRFGSGSVGYVVQVNDSLSKIAEACLGDRDYFVALARLNNIEVPRGLAYGQRIRVPGTSCEPALDPVPEPESVPLPVQVTEPPPEVSTEIVSPPDTDAAESNELSMALEAEQAGNLAGAYEFAASARKNDPQDPDVETAYRRIKADYIDSLASTAYEQDDQGDFDGALATWQRVLELDKYNAEARMMLRVLKEEAGGAN